MAQEDVYLEFLKKLKKEKSDKEIADFLADLFKLGSAQLYVAILSNLSETDMMEIEKIEDEKKAIEEMKNRFKLRTGITPEEFVNKLRDTISKNYLFPELNPQKSSPT